MKFHIIGMGVQGCLLANMLRDIQRSFTWHDTYAAINAHGACTGAIYPSGSEKFGPDEVCRAVWRSMHEQALYTQHITKYLEPAVWTYNHKQPPHEGRFAQREAHGLRQAVGPLDRSYHFNAQAFVADTRERFKGYRQELPSPGDCVIEAHGFGARLSHVYWGWTAPVKLKYRHELVADELRPAFYFRKGRFVMAYAYPIPGTEYWYAGSSIIKQSTPKHLDANKHFDRWLKNFTALGNGAVEVTKAMPCIAGWRPAAATGDTAWARRESDGRISLRPLWNSGVRHWPKQWNEFCKVAGLKDSWMPDQ